MKRVAAIALLALGTGGPVLAGEVADKTAFGNWVANCREDAAKGTECRLVQTLSRKEDQTLVVRFVVVPLPDGEAGMVAQVPIGAHLPAQPALKLPGSADTDNRAFVWQRCNPQICEAARKLSAAEVAEISAAGAFFFGYKPTPAENPLVVKVTADHFAEGLAAISR